MSGRTPKDHFDQLRAHERSSCGVGGQADFLSLSYEGQGVELRVFRLLMTLVSAQHEALSAFELQLRPGKK